MPASSRSKRVLIYSHDSFGLGHVSRCRTIANALVEADESVSVLILSGSPMIGSYEFHSGIDFVRVPGVVKQLSGEYDSANLRVGVEHTMEMRTRIIRDTADIFRPDLFIVDKEPLGLRGEVGPALRLLKDRGTPLVLGLRDVMDDPAALAQEWERKNVVPALRDLYDEIWIYGLPQINKPLTGIDVPPSVRHKTVYTGYLHRELPLHADIPHEIEEIDGPFILVTSGGGGDGEDLVDWVIAAYEHDPNIPYGAVIVFGPFMSATAREAFKDRAAKFKNIRTLTFTNNLGALMKRAAGVVAMGGYNTFCEILSFDKRAIIVPRTKPRLEQFIRARAARNIGLIEMLDADKGRDPQAMATALRQLPQQGLPSDVVVPGLLDGLGNVWRLVAKQLMNPHRGPARLEAEGTAESAEIADQAIVPPTRART
ncbi:MAG: glycosyltransferase [Reyranella sp.]|uniref:glycosyltransferase family protein n=1 Tax=Reyranella sp. TaxID=1929291 RepID=UPI00272FA2C1|nr:glycosyltransferase [Reyranella sp.]MDP1966234.1 glycosyltransferase [Reyranella sp.]MDP2378478.1 glycosyltransferase [Reyranella sp.]